MVSPPERAIMDTAAAHSTHSLYHVLRKQSYYCGFGESAADLGGNNNVNRLHSFELAEIMFFTMIAHQ